MIKIKNLLKASWYLIGIFSVAAIFILVSEYLQGVTDKNYFRDNFIEISVYFGLGISFTLWLILGYLKKKISA